MRLPTPTQSRFYSIWVMFVVAMTVFAITRTILLVYSLDYAGLSIPTILRIYGIGGIYDIAFYAYALVPVSLYLLLVPNRLWSSRATVFPHRYLGQDESAARYAPGFPGR